MTKVGALFALASFIALPVHADYPRASIKNNSPYPIVGSVEYASAFCSNDGYVVQPGETWTSPDDRGVCLITGISGASISPPKNGEKTAVTSYSSTGTSYSQFQINAYGGQYRIFSDQEFENVSKGAGTGPGFKFINKTSWPIAWSLDQVGCLHHGIAQPMKDGVPGVDMVTTGAFWFTVRVNIQPDGKDPVQGSGDCVSQTAANIGKGLLNSLGSAGSAIYETVDAYTDVEEFSEDGFRNAFEISGNDISNFNTDLWQDYMYSAGSATLKGQFAGYDWPFRCDAMPEYEITGGPQIVRSGKKIFFAEGETFKVTKINTCGDDMMPASPKSAEAEAAVPMKDISDSMMSEIRASKSNPGFNLPKSGLVTAEGYYWFLNGDGSRNWLSSAPPCAASAVKVARADIDQIHKRHNGTGGYELKADSYAAICASLGQPKTPEILTNGSYYWLINSDGTRNWLGSIPDACKAKAVAVQGSIDNYPKRAGGVDADGYQLKGQDLLVACDPSWKITIK